MKQPNLQELLDACSDSIVADEITNEAKTLIATLQGSDNRSQIISELFEYSSSLASMVLTNVLHVLYTHEQVQELIKAQEQAMADELTNEISQFLGGK
jgi:hypothetical protein